MQPLNKIIETLDLEEIELNHYLATSPNEGWQRVYGGQVIGQALVAASRTVDEDRQAHSLHGYFLRAGDKDIHHKACCCGTKRQSYIHHVHLVPGC